MLFRIEAQGQVLLVVPQPHVERGPVLLDELVLEHQGVLDGGRDDHLEVVDPLIEPCDARPSPPI